MGHALGYAATTIAVSFSRTILLSSSPLRNLHLNLNVMTEALELPENHCMKYCGNLIIKSTI